MTSVQVLLKTIIKTMHKKSMLYKNKKLFTNKTHTAQNNNNNRMMNTTHQNNNNNNMINKLIIIKSTMVSMTHKTLINKISSKTTIRLTKQMLALQFVISKMIIVHKLIISRPLKTTIKHNNDKHHSSIQTITTISHNKATTILTLIINQKPNLFFKKSNPRPINL